MTLEELEMRGKVGWMKDFVECSLDEFRRENENMEDSGMLSAGELGDTDQ